ncbi:MAG: acetyl-CoA hydrolase/transferase C-terminal domain-containing protein [Pseudomonadota bacterium]
MAKTISANEFTQLLQPGMRVFTQGCTAEPLTLLEALQAQPEACRGVDFVGVPLPGYNRADPASWHPEASMTTFFMTPELRRSPAAERIRFIPTHYSNVFRYLREMADLDMLVVQVAGEVRDGEMSYGLSSEHAPGAAESARIIVVEMNSEVPYTNCVPSLPLDRVDYIVETSRAPAHFPSPDLGEEARAIGRHAASVIGDGDCIQIGIGKLQSAAMQALSGHQHLGFHSGLVSDDTLALVEAGALTGQRKNRDNGVIVTGAVFGSSALHEFAADASVQLHSVAYTHEIPVIASIENFVSINACMQVDLVGQVIADNIYGRQISAPGGYGDFQRGARLSKGGRSIVLLASTTGDGTRSNIIPVLPDGAVLTGLRADTDFIVTEHGVADLRYKDIEQRARALIEIAAPQFREDLERAFYAAPK